VPPGPGQTSRSAQVSLVITWLAIFCAIKLAVNGSVSGDFFSGHDKFCISRQPKYLPVKKKLDVPLIRKPAEATSLLPVQFYVFYDCFETALCSILEKNLICDLRISHTNLRIWALLTGTLKGSLTRDFRLQVFFMNQCPPGKAVSEPTNR
jgi:hypothetical protein